MPDLSIGPVAKSGAIDATCPVGEPFAGSHIGLQQKLDTRLAEALQTAIDAIIEEKKIDAKVEAIEVTTVGDEVKTEVKASVETNAGNLQIEEDVQRRAIEIMGACRDGIVARAADLDLLSQHELAGLFKSLIKDESLDAAWRVEQDSLQQQAAEAREALTRAAECLAGTWPQAATSALAEHISTEVVHFVDIVEADRMAIDFLSCEGVQNVAGLIARSTDPALDAGSQQTMVFDAHLAMAYAGRFLKEQAVEARSAVQAALEELPAASQARKGIEARLAIAEQIPETQPETRKAVEEYYEWLAPKGHVEARDVLDRLLGSKDEVLLDYLVNRDREKPFDSRVAQALSPDPDVSARARRQIEQIEPDEQRARARRVSPIDGEGLKPGAELHIATAEVFDVVRTEILKMDNLAEAVQCHAEGRLRTAFTVLQLIQDLKDRGAIDAGAPVAVGGALFQLGKGCEVEDSQAAHKLAGQVYIGIDQRTLAELNEAQRAPYRLDTLLHDEPELETLAKMQAASTTVLPSYVNKVDSLWENQGLRNAFAQAVSDLVNRQDADAGVAQAYETFRAGTVAALEKALDHHVGKARQLEAELAAADAASHQLHETRRVQTQEVFDLYQSVLARTDANQAHVLMQDWLAKVLAQQNAQ